MANFSNEKQFAEEFGWMPMLYIAAGEDFLKIDKIVNKEAIEFLNFINFYKRKSELDNERIQKSYNR